MPATPLALDFQQSVKSRQSNFYKIIQSIGSGKNASTHLALQTSKDNNGTVRVLKILNDPADATGLRKFNSEIATLAQLDHNSIMKISDTGVFETSRHKFPFYVCDYYNETLASVISKRRASLFEKAGYAIQLCSALAYLASRNLIHYDIKPDNIFVDGIKCILGDFGLAAEKSSQCDYSLPSLHKYRSPDIVKAMRGDCNVSAKSDVFLLGLTLAELFTGKNICKESEVGNSEVELCADIRISGKHGLNISNIIMQMLDFNPDARPSAKECINKWEYVLFEVGGDLLQFDGRII